MAKIIIIAALVIGAVIIVVLMQNGDDTALLNSPTPTENVISPTVTVSPISSPTASPRLSPTSQPVAQTKVVAYASAGFSPSSVTINVGDSITFKNNSDGDFWPASAIHPTHNAYPVKGGCIGSMFDACQRFGPGQEWTFKFTEKGTWRYHDHLSSQFTGTIVVQ